MSNLFNSSKVKFSNWSVVRRLAVIFAILGPGTITAMADNDAGGVATYSVAGAKLGYPILFLLLMITVMLGITQEMGMRLTLVTRRGLADLIREKYGVRVSMFIFLALVIANLGTITVNLSAVKTTAYMFNVPQGFTPLLVIGMVLISFFFITRGSYRLTQNIMLLVSLFYLAYIISAFKASPDWGLALSNLIYPHGVKWTPEYLRSYLLIGMGVLGTTITPWGQFFISSFAGDKKMDKDTLRYSQMETYWGAFLTDFFSFFMIIATAATLFVHNIPLVSGEQAAEAIRPFAGNLASQLFAIGILNAAFMGMNVVSLSTAYAFSEFFGFSGSLDFRIQEKQVFLYPVSGPIDFGLRDRDVAGRQSVHPGDSDADAERDDLATGIPLFDSLDQRRALDGGAHQFGFQTKLCDRGLGIHCNCLCDYSRNGDPGNVILGYN